MVNSTLNDTQLLANLLAVIHRDGGHYQHEHGSFKATYDAIEVVYDLRTESEKTDE